MQVGVACKHPSSGVGEPGAKSKTEMSFHDEEEQFEEPDDTSYMEFLCRS